MEKKLISMIEFVLKNDQKASMGGHYDRLVRYANFLNTTLNLGMFVPAILVNGKWVVLEEPIFSIITNEGTHTNSTEYVIALEQYQQAKDKVIFEGFEAVTYNHSKDNHFELIENSKLDIDIFCKDVGSNDWVMDNLKIVNDLIKYAPTLTEYGKQISGLNK